MGWRDAAEGKAASCDSTSFVATEHRFGHAWHGLARRHLELEKIDIGKHETPKLMSDETQALCLLAGANSIFVGTKLLTTPNPQADHDARLFEKLGHRDGNFSYRMSAQHL